MNNGNYISNEEHFKIARELEKHHAIFERIWTMSRIRFSKKVPTAGVMFNKKGDCIDFIVNREFWDSQSFEQKCFVLAHECMHIALNHGKRAREFYKNRKTQMISNFAQDLVINHALVNRYGFDRDVIDPRTEEAPQGKYCWKDKLLPKHDHLTEEENYEVYFNELMKEAEKAEEKFKEMMENAETVDDHDFNQGEGMPMPMDAEGEGEGEGKGEDGDDDGEGKDGNGDVDPDDYDYMDMDDYSDDFSDAIDKLDEELTADEKETLKNFVEENDGSNETPEGENREAGGGGPAAPNSPGGTQAGGKWNFAKALPPKKRKWEAIVTDWAKKKLTEEYKEVDQWVHTNRRFSMIDSGLHLPTEYEVLDEFEEQDLINAWFFQDTSGSCAGYKDRFFAIAESMPEDKFDMQLFCFDTAIYETDLKSRKLYGFGGTYFHIIEEYIQKRMTEDPRLKYPDAVFVVTDGYGSDVVPAKPENWHWILTPGASTGNFPETCNKYDLAKYE